MDFDLELLRVRGANLCEADRFDIRACCSCGRHYLFNNELKDVYYDPFNLTKRFFYIDSIALPPCAGCGDIDWALSAPVPLVESLLGIWGWLHIEQT
jgi:hypothetical protein